MNRLPPIAVLDNNHYTVEDFSERLTTKEWQSLLLNGKDIIVYRGCVRKIVAKNLGYGVVEVSKAKKDE